MTQLCLICGRSKEEVLKMHCFPRNLAKCKLWHDSLGIHYSEELHKYRNFRICSNHFSNNDYDDNMCLKPDALPRKHHQTTDISNVPETRNMMESDFEMPVVAGPSKDRSENLPIEQVRKSIFRGIRGVSKTWSTPRKQKLMKCIESKESHIRKLKKLSKERANSIKQLSDLADSAVVRNIFEGMPSKIANFLISQLRCCKKSPKGRRWTMDDKILALALYKRGPKSYRLLQKIVAMPSKKTLMDLLRQVPFESGINIHMLQHINNSIKNEDDRVCALLMDEMDIKCHVEYDCHADKIRGYEDISATCGMANKVLVFMVKGLHHHWKQPIAFYFSNEAVPGYKLSDIMVEVIEACQNYGNLDIVVTINDCGTNNVKALKKLNSSILNPCITVGGKTIFTMYDPPHLLKCTTSLFRRHNVELPVASFNNEVIQARFGDIRAAYEIDTRSPLIFRAMHKIKQHHLDPKLKYTMKVNLAAQIMSRTVSSFVYTLLSRGELEQRSIATATFVHQVDELFDSFNGTAKSLPDGKPLKCAIGDQSGHLVYWRKAYTMVNSWKFLRRNKKGTLLHNKPPSQIAWLTTIVAIGKLWKFLHKEKHFTCLKPRALNQDALENLFGAIRSGLGCNDNPTTVQFVGSLKTQILNGLINLGSGRNCEEDDAILLTNLNNFLSIPDSRKSEGGSSIETTVINADTLATDIACEVSSGSVKTMSVAYVGGFIIKKNLAKYSCQDCSNMLLSSSEAPHNAFISFKEWCQEEKLIYPAEQPVVSVGTAIRLLEDFLESNANISHLSQHVEKLLIENVDFNWVSCLNHREVVIKSIVRGVWKIGIPWWCKRQVRSLRNQEKNAQNKKLQILTHK